jgi:hypothetical protein
MSELPASSASQAAGSTAQAQPPLDTKSMTVSYSNYFRASANRMEVFIDFGLRSHVQGAEGLEPIILSHRLVLNYATAAQLANFLNQLLQQQARAAQPGTGGL